MKDIWQNVKLNNTIVIGKERIPNKKELLIAFEDSIKDGNWKFKEWKQKRKAPYQCIINDGIKDIDIVLYLKAISNAGWDYKPEYKRVQVGNRNLLDLKMLRKQNATKLNLIIGYYNYEKPIFAGWNANEYTRHRTNRSCYVNVGNLIKGYQNDFFETECFGQPVTVFKPEFLTTYINQYISYKIIYDQDEQSIDKLLDIATELYTILDEYNKQIDYYWDGKEKIIEMKNDNSKNWKQMEWPGFYLEHLIEKKLYSQLDFNGATFENTKFDVFEQIPWDLKVHTINSSNPNKIPTNDLNAINYAVNEFGYVGFIILEGEAIWDEENQFKRWHDDLKGKKSRYRLKGDKINRKSRRRKLALKVKGLKVILIDKDSVKKQPQFQNNMINSNGTIRNAKMLLDLNLIEKENILLEKEFKG